MFFFVCIYTSTLCIPSLTTVTLRVELLILLLIWISVKGSWSSAAGPAEKLLNDPAGADDFQPRAFDSPQGQSKVARTQFWVNRSTCTRSGGPLFPKLSTHSRARCSQLFSIPVKFVQWPESSWLWLEMAWSHPAAHSWTAGCLKDRKSWIRTLYHLLPMKYWFCSLRAFNLCLGDIYFLENGSGGHIVSLLHLPGCNNSMWILKLLGERDILVSVIQHSTCPSDLITSSVLTLTAHS